MSEKNKLEYIGYGKLYKVFKNWSAKLTKIANDLRFEQYKILFGQRDSDIYIVTYPKSGTTLMQMILYQLTTDGNMDFKHIYDVSPWIQNASFKNQKPVKLPSPRLIKSHDYYKGFPKETKGRFIYVYRNGMDVAVSQYHQQKNYNNSGLKFEDFIKDFFKKKLWFKHTKEWFVNKKKFPILYVEYDKLIHNKKNEIKRIVEFLNLNVDDIAIERALKYSSFEYMKENETKFGDQPVEEKIFNEFIRKGKSGQGKEHFSEEQKKKFAHLFQTEIEPLTKKLFNS